MTAVKMTAVKMTAVKMTEKGGKFCPRLFIHDRCDLWNGLCCIVYSLTGLFPRTGWFIVLSVLSYPFFMALSAVCSAAMTGVIRIPQKKLLMP